MARFKAIDLDQAAMEKWYRLFGQENPTELQSFSRVVGGQVPESKKESLYLEALLLLCEQLGSFGEDHI